MCPHEWLVAAPCTRTHGNAVSERSTSSGLAKPSGKGETLTFFLRFAFFCLWPRVSGAESRPVLQAARALQNSADTTQTGTQGRGCSDQARPDQSLYQPVLRQQRWQSGYRQAALTAQTGPCLQSAASPAESSQPCSSQQ